MHTLAHIGAQGAAEYGAVSGGAAAATSATRSPLLDALPMDLLTHPLVLAAAGLAFLILVGLLRTGRYRS